jgi:predicted nucleic acid-binding protein
MEPSGAWLEQLGVRRCELSGSQVEKVAEMAARYLRPSRLDLFALVQAKGEGAVLLTDDGDLRAAAENEGLQVHGTLWLLDQLVAQGVVSKERAVEGLKQMKKAGSWLPKEEVGRRLRSWEG